MALRTAAALDAAYGPELQQHPFSEAVGYRMLRIGPAAGVLPVNVTDQVWRSWISKYRHPEPLHHGCPCRVETPQAVFSTAVLELCICGSLHDIPSYVFLGALCLVFSGQPLWPQEV